MTRKTDILDLIVSELKKINGISDTRVGLLYNYKKNVNENVTGRYRYIQEINDFPAICLMVGDETRTHIGGGIKYGNLEISVRGYLHEDNTLNEEDDFLDDIEHVMSSISYLNSDCEIIECIVTSVGSDDGLMEPFGVCEVNCQLVYELDNSIS